MNANNSMRLKESEGIGRICKGMGDTRGFRARFLEILLRNPEHEMLLADLVHESSTDPAFYITYQTAKFHLLKMQDAGIVEISDTPLPSMSGDGLKIQTLIRLKRDVKVYVRDLGSL